MDQINLLTISADTWLRAMAETTLRTSVIVLVAGGVALGLRRGPATLRHLVWALALAGVPAGSGHRHVSAGDRPSVAVVLEPVRRAVGQRYLRSRLARGPATRPGRCGTASHPVGPWSVPDTDGDPRTRDGLGARRDRPRHDAARRWLAGAGPPDVRIDATPPGSRALAPRRRHAADANRPRVSGHPLTPPESRATG